MTRVLYVKFACLRSRVISEVDAGKTKGRMAMVFACEENSSAMQQYRRAGMTVAAGLVITCAGLSLYLSHHNPTGTMLYALASLPSFQILSMVFVMGAYLKREKDEFQRDQMVRSILWGTGAVLAVSTYLGFLQLMGWTGHRPFLVELAAFCWAMVIARWSYRRANRVREDA